MIKLLYKPAGMLVSVLGGVIAGAIFKRVWKVAAGEEGESAGRQVGNSDSRRDGAEEPPQLRCIPSLGDGRGRITPIALVHCSHYGMGQNRA